MPRPPHDRTIAIAITPPVAGAQVQVQVNANPTLWVQGVSNSDGYVAWQCSDALGDSALRITAEGYQPYEIPIHWKNFIDNAEEIPPLNQQLTVGIDLPPLKREREPVPLVPLLYPDRTYLIDQNTGNRVLIKGVDQFRALRMVLDGEDLGPLILESTLGGANCWRIFCQGSARQNGIVDLYPQREPGYWDAVHGLNRVLNEAGILPLWTVFVDNQDVRLGPDHWVEFHKAVAPYQKLVSGGNEWSKNGFDPQALPLPPPTSPVWSRGSNVTEPAEPVAPNGATFVEFHPRRDWPKVLDDTVASANNFRYTRKWNVPLIVDEPPRLGTDGSGDPYLDPDVCAQLGAGYRVACAGAVFHSRAGQRGVVMDQTTRICFEAWMRGLGDGPHP